MNLNNEQIRQILDGDGTYRQKYQQIFGEDVTKDTARHRLNRLRDQLINDNVTDTQAIFKDTIKIDNSGQQCSEKLLECSPEQLKDPEYLLQMHGYDASKFQLVSATASIWQNSTKDNKTLYSSRVHVRPLAIEQNLAAVIEKTVDNLFADKAENYSHRRLTNIQKRYAKAPHNDKYLEICLPDLHFGLTENENSNALYEFEQLFERKTFEIGKIIQRTQPDWIDLVFLGDILHYDNAQKTTTKGTPQCSTVSFETMFTSASENIIMLVDYILETVNSIDKPDTQIRVIYVPGNHDTILGYTLMTVVGAYFHDNEHIIFDLKQTDRKFTMYGNNLVGFIHGDMNAKRINQWLYKDAKQLISRADQIEIHCGHLHSEQVVEDNGVITRHLPTICGVSPFERTQGYQSVKRLSAFLWDGYEGLKNIFYI